jgi:hypothetical protein
LKKHKPRFDENAPKNLIKGNKPKLQWVQDSSKINGYNLNSADSQNILNRWKNYFSQLLNTHNISDDRQIEV